jgi:hypothetical protein
LIYARTKAWGWNAIRNLLDAFNEAKKTAGLTIIKMVVTGLVMAVLTGTLIKLKLFGGAQ